MKKKSWFWSTALIMLLVLVSVSGCGGGGGRAAGTKGGNLVVAFTYEPATMDPEVTGQAHASRMLTSIFDPYIWMDPEGKTYPGLATSWETSADGKVWTLKLRKGVKFHDGTPFNAKAAKFSFDRIVDPKTASQSAISALYQYEKSEVVDDYTIKIYMKEPVAAFLRSLSGPLLSPVSPTAVQKLGDQGFARMPVGTGPFMMKEWVDNDHITIVRFPDYNWAPEGLFKHKGAAYLDSVIYKFVQEEQVRYTALNTGEVQAIEGAPAQLIGELEKKHDKFTVYKIPFPGVLHAMINVKKAPTDDIKVRQAILFAYNTDAVVKNIMFGSVLPGNGPMSAGNWASIPDYRSTYKYDPAKAKSLLDEAGWKMGSDGFRYKDGTKLKLVLNQITTGNYDQIATAIQADMRAVGMDLEIKAMSRSPWYASNGKGEHNLVPMGFYSSDPGMLKQLWHSKGGVFTWSFYNNPEYDSLVDRGAAENDQTKRAELYKQAQKLLIRDAVALAIYDQMNLFATSADVKGLVWLENSRPHWYDVYFEKK